MSFYTGSTSLSRTSSSLDTIGLAGFSHDFGSLDGKTTSIATALDTLGSSPSRSMLNTGFFVLSQVLTALVYYPTKRSVLMQEIQHELSNVSKELLDKRRKEKEAGIVDGKAEKSVIGLLRMHSFFDPVTPLTNPCCFKLKLKKQIQISICLMRKLYHR